MGTQYSCKSLGRRNAVKNQKALNGIDYLEVASVDQKTLKVHFIHNLPGQSDPVPPSPAPALTTSNVSIMGGVRIKNIRVVSVSAAGNVLTVVVKQAGDFSTYHLTLITSSTSSDPPSGFDPQLSSVDFSFKASCPNDFDCASEAMCSPEQQTEPVIDYLAKDYSSFRRLMLDRLSTIMPDWETRNAADLQMVLVELLAYVGDYLSYYQDAVATEAYLGTARKRISVRRHARLLDYQVHDGCNARAWICFEVEKGSGADGQTIEAGTVLLTRGVDDTDVVTPDNLETVLREDPVVFETIHDVILKSPQNSISFYTWSDSECCLPSGSTRATLLDDPALSLSSGDVLIFEEIVSPTTGTKADADSTRRHIVRLKEATQTSDPLTGTNVVEIRWFDQDALPFSLCLTALVTNASGTPEVVETSVARGNVVLADHGMTITGGSLDPAEVTDDERYRPILPETDITFCVSYDDGAARNMGAASIVQQDPHEALPAVTLEGEDKIWAPQRDLLGSDRFAAEFVVEVESDGTAQLRFGDDVLGKRPSVGAAFSATYRVGNGSSGNVGAEAIGRLVTKLEGVTKVRNPLAATGGTDAETIKEVRQFAPEAFRIQERAVTEADYAEVAERHSEVERAAANFRWTGSWYTAFATIDRTKGLSVEADPAFRDEMLEHLEKYRVAGYDIKIDGPVLVPLDILLQVCVKSDYFGNNVKESLLEAFGSQDPGNGKRGFFHPDNFTFGQAVYVSQICRTAMEIAGVESVQLLRFQRWGKEPAGEIGDGFIKPSDLEIIILANDPNYPENGRIQFEIHGGM